MKRARVIYNPTSGKELIRKHLADILEVLEKAGYEASAFATTALPSLLAMKRVGQGEPD